MTLDSQVVVKSLLAVDPQFEALCKSLFGDVVDPEAVWGYLYTREGAAEVMKMDPTPPDIAVKAGKLVKVRRAFNPNVRNAIVNGVVSGITGAGAASLVAARNKKVEKGLLKLSPNMTNALVGGGVSGVAGTAAAVAPKPKKKKKPALTVVPPSEMLGKAAEVTWEVEFSKIDEDKHQVFGWASIVQLDGEPVVDRQGDYISPEEIEKAAYNYVVKSRKGGSQHKRTEDGQPFHASDMIESIVFTPEKIEKMHLPPDFPQGWWVGYKVTDEDTWQRVKKGEVTGFSVHGRGKRQEVA